MRILFAIKGMENAAGGTERVISMLIPGLMARGHNVTLVSFDRAGAESFYPLPDGLRWIQLGSADVRHKLTLKEAIRSIRCLRTAVRELRPDAAVGFMHSMYVPLAAALLGTGVPLIASEHIVPRYYRTRRLEYVLLTLASLRAKRITALSRAIANQYPAPVRRRMVPIPNPVAAPTQQRNGKDHEAAEAGQVLLTIGRMDNQKDQATLIHAFAAIASDFPNWRLRIVGDGPLRSDLEALVAHYGLGDRVEMPGVVRDTVREYIHADLFVLPSRYESFGMVAAEALTYGLPVVAFADCPGVNEIVEDGKNGVLVEERDRTAGLAAALNELLGDPDRRKRLGREGPHSVMCFQPESIVDRWEGLLGDAVPSDAAHQ